MTVYYSKDHEWISVEGGIGTCGITEHAQDKLGDVVFVELPETGRKLDRHEACAVVESVKAASDIYAPVSGEIVEANAALVESPAMVNEAAESDAWFFKIKLANTKELDELMSAEAYQEYLKTLDD